METIVDAHVNTLVNPSLSTLVDTFVNTFSEYSCEKYYGFSWLYSHEYYFTQENTNVNAHLLK